MNDINTNNNKSKNNNNNSTNKKFVIFLRWALFRGRNVDRYENPC